MNDDRSKPHRPSVPRIPPWKEETRWYWSRQKFIMSLSLNACDAPDDLEMVLDRSRLAGVKSMIITGGSLHESKEALELARTHGPFLAWKNDST